jgi:hypothetical protein
VPIAQKPLPYQDWEVDSFLSCASVFSSSEQDDKDVLSSAVVSATAISLPTEEDDESLTFSFWKTDPSSGTGISTQRLQNTQIRSKKARQFATGTVGAD